VFGVRSQTKGDTDACQQSGLQTKAPNLRAHSCDAAHPYGEHRHTGSQEINWGEIHGRLLHPRRGQQGRQQAQDRRKGQQIWHLAPLQLHQHALGDC